MSQEKGYTQRQQEELAKIEVDSARGYSEIVYHYANELYALIGEATPDIKRRCAEELRQLAFESAFGQDLEPLEGFCGLRCPQCRLARSLPRKKEAEYHHLSKKLYEVLNNQAHWLNTYFCTVVELRRLVQELG